MSKDTKDDGDRAFLQRVYNLTDETPVDEVEALEILKDVGIDVAAALSETMAHIASVEQRIKQARFANAESERRAALVPRVTTKKRTHAELLTRLAELRSSAGAQALFSGLESIGEEDLAELVAQLEELVRRGEEEK
jgi:hypothetical protein